MKTELSSTTELETPESGAALTPVTLRALWSPKEGNTAEQYEDAFACSTLEGNPARVTVALADGASSAVFAREWAHLLVSAFVVTGFPPRDADAALTFSALSKEWQGRIEGKATSWWAQERLPDGSAATLLVVTWDRENLLWEASVIGDVCVFLVRNDKLRYAFPLTHSTRFGDRPDLVSTEIGRRAKMPEVIRYVERYEAGDRFLLMTDALAQFFLSRFESRERPWNSLPQTAEELPDWLKPLRDAGTLKNDDVTLLDLTL